MSPFSSWSIFASLLLTTVLVPASLAAPGDIRTGTIFVYDSKRNLKGWVDKGSNMGNAFKVIWNLSPVGGGDYWWNAGSFSFKDNGPGKTIRLVCDSCGEVNKAAVSLQMGTGISDYSFQGRETAVWFPVALNYSKPGDPALLQRRDPSQSIDWTIDANSNLTPVLHDVNGKITEQALHANVWNCEQNWSKINCDVYWGPHVEGATDVTPLTLWFNQTSP